MMAEKPDLFKKVQETLRVIHAINKHTAKGRIYLIMLLALELPALVLMLRRNHIDFIELRTGSWDPCVLIMDLVLSMGLCFRKTRRC
jgi:hypothetical protein